MRDESLRRRKEAVLHILEPAHEQHRAILAGLKVFVQVMLDNGFRKKKVAFVVRIVHMLLRRRWEKNIETVLFEHGFDAYQAARRRLRKPKV